MHSFLVIAESVLEFPHTFLIVFFIVGIHLGYLAVEQHFHALVNALVRVIYKSSAVFEHKVARAVYVCGYYRFSQDVCLCQYKAETFVEGAEDEVIAGL